MEGQGGKPGAGGGPAAAAGGSRLTQKRGSLMEIAAKFFAGNPGEDGVRCYMKVDFDVYFVEHPS